VSFRPPAEPPASILVIRLGALGDVIRTLPAVSCLRASYPDARIGWAVEEPSRSILEGHPDIDVVHVLSRRALRAGPLPARLLRAPGLLRAFSRELRAAGFAWTVDLHGSFKSALIARMSGGERIFGLGRGHARERADLFYTDPLPIPRRRMSRVDRALEAARLLGADVSSPRRILPPRAEAAGAAEAFLSREAAGAPRVLISPGTSEAQAFKRYPPRLFARLADLLVERAGATVILAWGPGEEAIAGQVRSAMARKAVTTPPTGLLDLAEIARRCDLFIGSDTGPLHLAAAAGIPVIALYGPTDAVTNAPYTESAHLEIEGDVSCRPCRYRGCVSRACLWRIDPEMVAGAAMSILGTAATSPGSGARS
jgi:lipopolysaccharide heptosyltransferase I